jgi:hypothetical protein
MLCMALAVMLSGQAFISVMDRIQHAQHHDHFPNVLAGDLQFCVGTSAACENGKHGAHDPIAPHTGDAAIVFLAAQSFVLSLCPVSSPRCELEPPMPASIHPRGPDHPPKSDLEIRV